MLLKRRVPIAGSEVAPFVLVFRSPLNLHRMVRSLGLMVMDYWTRRVLAFSLVNAAFSILLRNRFPCGLGLLPAISGLGGRSARGWGAGLRCPTPSSSLEPFSTRCGPSCLALLGQSSPVLQDLCPASDPDEKPVIVAIAICLRGTGDEALLLEFLHIGTDRTL